MQPVQKINFKVAYTLPARADTSSITDIVTTYLAENVTTYGGPTGVAGPTGSDGNALLSYFWAGRAVGLTGAGTVLLTPQSSANSPIFNFSSSNPTQVGIPQGAMFITGTFTCTIPGSTTGTLTMSDTSSSPPIGLTATSTVYNASTGPAIYPFSYSTLKRYVTDDNLSINATGITSVNSGLLMIQRF